jgi:hypothetical protein
MKAGSAPSELAQKMAMLRMATTGSWCGAARCQHG